MKNRIFKVVNFIAFNLLFFALYLNFIHKDKEINAPVKHVVAATTQGTYLVSNPEQYLNKESAKQLSYHNSAAH